ncbi:MAG: AgmX/PglI C-terminal domain-containing protein [Myxococcota bacterium]
MRDPWPARGWAPALLIVGWAGALGCGTESTSDREDSPTDPVETAESAATLEAMEEPEPRYDVHEWGLISLSRTDNDAAYVTGPGHFPPPPLPSAWGFGPGSRPNGMPQISHSAASIRKPVLYVHLADGTESVTFDARVEVPGGEVREHWPLAELSRDAVVWSQVRAAPGECSGLAYPAADEAPCTEVSDGFCEVAELESYETSDGACLQFGEAIHDHLFYRATKIIAPPVSVALDGEELVLSGDAQQSVLRIRRHPRRGRTIVERLNLPEDGTELRTAARLRSGESAYVGLRMIEDELTAIGLTDVEQQAFVGAWEDHLFGREHGPATPVQASPAPEALRPMRDALLYFLPADSTDAIAELTFDPPPRTVRRALAILVDLRPLPRDRSSAGVGILGRTSPARPPVQPRIRFPRPNVRGSLDVDIVRRIVRRHAARYRFCYEQELQRDPNIEGRVRVRFTIGVDGDVVQSAIAGNTTGSSSVGECLVRGMRRMRFPTPEGVVIVDQPVVFSAR